MFSTVVTQALADFLQQATSTLRAVENYIKSKTIQTGAN